MFGGVPAEMVKVIYTKVSADTCRKNRNFYKNHVRKAFIMWLAYKNFFNGIFTKKEIREAKRGRLPPDCNIHHKIPLSGTDDSEMVNSFANLVVIHKTTHERINREIFQPQLSQIIKAPIGTQVEIDIPEYGYVDRRGIIEERNKINSILKEHKKRCQKR